jgi:poly-gamma-glutamate synthesis protein (capsule biosynthesis protein)
MKFQVLVFLCIIVTSAIAQDTTRLSLLFAGDIMGHDSQIASAYDPVKKAYDYASCFQFIRPYVDSVDVAIANLEVTLAGPPYKGYPQFSSPDALAKTLRDIGFDVLVTANNHSVDRGRKGIERTITMLDSLKIAHTGTFRDSLSKIRETPLLFERNGFKLAILNYTYGTNGIAVPKPNIVNHLDTAVMRQDILKAKETNPDAIIAFTHWGAEYQSLPSKNQKDLTEFCFKHGVQLVIGAHPHVVQPMEWRKDKNQFVAYSLGNYVSGQRKRYTDGGAMAYLELQKISYHADSAHVTIDSAGYYLAWVYRTVDSNKDYYLLPVDHMDQHLKFVKDTESKAAQKIFIEDSRTLFRKFNRDVEEMKRMPVGFGRTRSTAEPEP